MSLWDAVLKVQKSVAKVVKDGNNPHHKSKYATLENTLNALNDHLNENDLVVNQETEWHQESNSWVMKTVITKGNEEHSFLKPLMGLENAKNPMQALGSAETYARRYALMSFFKLAPTDDDAEGMAQKQIKHFDFEIRKMIDAFSSLEVTKEMIESKYGEIRKLSKTDKEELRQIYQAIVDGEKPSKFF